MTVDYLPHACDQMRTYVDDPRLPVGYTPRFREYWIPLVDGHAYQRINFCPWCGADLPDSLRYEYFDALEGIDPEFDVMTELSDLPAEFRGDSWWRADGTD